MEIFKYKKPYCHDDLIQFGKLYLHAEYTYISSPEIYKEYPIFLYKELNKAIAANLIGITNMIAAMTAIYLRSLLSCDMMAILVDYSILKIFNENPTIIKDYEFTTKIKNINTENFMQFKHPSVFNSIITILSAIEKVVNTVNKEKINDRILEELYDYAYILYLIFQPKLFDYSYSTPITFICYQLTKQPTYPEIVQVNVKKQFLYKNRLQRKIMGELLEYINNYTIQINHFAQIKAAKEYFTKLKIYKINLNLYKNLTKTKIKNSRNNPFKLEKSILKEISNYEYYKNFNNLFYTNYEETINEIKRTRRLGQIKNILQNKNLLPYKDFPIFDNSISAIISNIFSSGVRASNLQSSAVPYKIQLNNNDKSYKQFVDTLIEFFNSKTQSLNNLLDIAERIITK